MTVPSSQTPAPGEPGGDSQSPRLPLTPGDRSTLLSLARLALQTYVKTGRLPEMAPRGAGVCQEAGAFVTLSVLGRPRGQMGMLPGDRPLYRIIMNLTVSAATEDDRFAPIDPSELHQTRIQIAVAGALEPIRKPGDLVVGQHGILVPGDPPTAIPPEMALEKGWNSLEFLKAASRQAGLAPDSWESRPVFRFTTDRFSEESPG